MGTRRKSRELAMQMLFQGDLGKQTPEQVSKLFWPSRDSVDDETRGFAEDIYRIATSRQDEIDKLLLGSEQDRAFAVKVLVCRGDMEGGWVAPAELGFNTKAPF